MMEHTRSQSSDIESSSRRHVRWKGEVGGGGKGGGGRKQQGEGGPCFDCHRSMEPLGP